jgi:TonB family protein
MRSALIISLGLHVLVSLIAFQWVSFREVKYVPRQVYNVTLVTPEVQAEPVRQQEVTPPAPQPEPEEAEPEPEPEEEMPPPPDEPKSKPKPKPKPKKTVPTTEIEKTKPAETDAYINRIRRKIAASWRVPEGSQGQERFCRVYFRVHRDGSVSDVSVEDSSGLFLFDQSAERAVVLASPMPPLPREFKDAYLGVHFSFAYREKR